MEQVDCCQDSLRVAKRRIDAQVFIFSQKSQQAIEDVRSAKIKEILLKEQVIRPKINMCVSRNPTQPNLVQTLTFF